MSMPVMEPNTQTNNKPPSNDWLRSLHPYEIMTKEAYDLNKLAVIAVPAEFRQPGIPNFLIASGKLDYCSEDDSWLGDEILKKLQLKYTVPSAPQVNDFQQPSTSLIQSFQSRVPLEIPNLTPLTESIRKPMVSQFFPNSEFYSQEPTFSQRQQAGSYSQGLVDLKRPEFSQDSEYFERPQQNNSKFDDRNRNRKKRFNRNKNRNFQRGQFKMQRKRRGKLH